MLRPQVADFEDPIAFLDAWMTWKKRTFGVRPNTYSQRMFARDAGRPKQTSLFSHILSGRRPLRGDVLEDTIRALALPTDEEQVLRHLTVPPSERSASTARRLEGARARARARYAQCEARFLSSWQHLATWELAHLAGTTPRQPAPQRRQAPHPGNAALPARILGRSVRHQHGAL